MKKLLVVVVLVVAGVVVYAKVIRSKPAEVACDVLHKRCGKAVPADKCTKEIEEVADVIGDKNMDKAVDCMESADSCGEAMGCLMGAGSHMFDDVKKGFDRARE